MHPNEAGLEDLPLDENLEVLHATIETLGHQRFLAAAKAQLVQEDDFGRLHRIQFHDYEPLLMVEVVNATPDPDGTVRRHPHPGRGNRPAVSKKVVGRSSCSRPASGSDPALLKSFIQLKRGPSQFRKSVVCITAAYVWPPDSSRIPAHIGLNGT